MTQAARDIERLRQANERMAELWAAYCDKAGPQLPPEGTREFIQVRRAFFSGMALMQSAAIITLLQRIAQWRPLSRRESEMLARLLRRQGPKRQTWHWAPQDDAKVLALIRKRATQGRPRPYERNSEVRRLAKRLGRSTMAVQKRIERLRRANGIPGNCPTGSGAQPSLN